MEGLKDCSLFKLLINRRESTVAQSLSGHLLTMEPIVASSLENIKINFSSFTEHGIQHSIRIIKYIYSILNDSMKESLSDVEIFCLIMSALFHDMGMTLTDIDDKEKQRSSHHLYVQKPIEEYCEKYLTSIAEYKRICDCVSFVCEGHGRDIVELYSDEKFRKEDTIQGQKLKFGLLTIFLRIGDLMDMEEGRTNEFYMHLNNFKHMNNISLEHNERHLEIKEYNHKPEFINVVIVTKNRFRYKIWEEWLKYLDVEVMYANSHYLTRFYSEEIGNYKFPEVIYKIIPHKDADFMVEEIHFQVDDKGALWELLTNSIYTNEFDYIRELVQNAIDANLLRYYLDESYHLEFKSPRSWNIKEKVIIAYSERNAILCICDYGIGMDEKDIRNYLFKAADSGYRYKKRRKDFEFPSIAKFGIGFVACLTKAKKIEIYSQAVGCCQVKAEIENKSNIAFIQKGDITNKKGTRIKTLVKNNVSFKEVHIYLMETFIYPSVNLQVVDLDKLIGFGEKICFHLDDGYSIDHGDIDVILNNIQNLQEKRNIFLEPIYQDNKLLDKIVSLLDGENENSILESIKLLLSIVGENSIVKKNFKAAIDNNSLKSLRDEIKNVRRELEKESNEYPEFIYEINNKAISKLVDYEILNVQIDENFYVEGMKHGFENHEFKGRGILYIRTIINDQKVGIEWNSVNAFIYNKGKIEKNMIKVSSENSNKVNSDEIISLDELADADYEMNLIYEQEEDELYYKKTIEGNDLYNIYNDDIWGYNLDVIFMKNNDFFLMRSVESNKIERVKSDDYDNKISRFFDKVWIDKDYYSEEYEIRESALHQDGIKMQFNPQNVIPLGVGWSVCNLTADARLELNASRHEINMHREIIDNWINNYGSFIQIQIATNCINVLKKIGLDYSVDNIMNDDYKSTYFEKCCYEKMKSSLEEILTAQ